MSELDENGLGAAIEAYRHDGQEQPCRMGIVAAIRAYEAYKASTVPEEIAEVVKDLRIYLDLMDTQKGEHKVPWMYNVCKRAADLLESAIRAYEAYKETTFDPTAQLGGVIPPPSDVSRPPTDAVGYKEGDVLAIVSAVPEEIAEVVEWCRRKGLGTPPDSMPNRAADLLEGYVSADCASGAAREMKEALEMIAEMGIESGNHPQLIARATIKLLSSSKP